MFSNKKGGGGSSAASMANSSSSSPSGFFSFEEEDDERKKEEKQHEHEQENDKNDKKKKKKKKKEPNSKAKPIKSILKRHKPSSDKTEETAGPPPSLVSFTGGAGDGKKGGGSHTHEHLLQEQQLTKLNTLLNRELSSAGATGSKGGTQDGNNAWKVTRLKLGAVRAFQQHVKQDAKKNKTKYSSQEVTKLLGEMQTDLERVLSHSGRSSTLSVSAGRLSIDDVNWENNNSSRRRSSSVANDSSSYKNASAMHQSREEALTQSFDDNEQKLMDALESDSESYLKMKKKWTTPTENENKQNKSRFKAAVNAVMFVGATKRRVRFTTRSVRKFERSSSFWDHEYWDEKEEDTLSSTSLSSSQGTSLSMMEKSWMNEWESRVTLMPSEKDLQRACLKLVVVWVETGHFPSNKSYKWQRKFGRLSPADLIYHRIHRYPAVALRKLAQLCNRSPSFFLDSEDRQEVALVYLYDALATWENGGNQGDIQDVIRECKHEIERAARAEKIESKKKGWNAFVGKVEGGMKKLVSSLSKAFGGSGSNQNNNTEEL